MGKLLISSFLCTAAAVCLVASNALADAGISIVTNAPSVTVGSDFTVDINIANVTDLYAYQFDFSFNPAVIQAVSSSEGSFLSKGGTTFFIPGVADNSKGVVAASADTLIGQTKGVTGSGNLLVLTFDAIKTGVSPLAVSGGQFLNSSLGSVATHSVGGSISVISTKAPEIDPESTLAALTMLAGALALVADGASRPSKRLLS